MISILISSRYIMKSLINKSLKTMKKFYSSRSLSPMENTKKYVASLYPGRTYLLDNSLEKDNDNVYGYNACEILIREVGDFIHYKPLFKE